MLGAQGMAHPLSDRRRPVAARGAARCLSHTYRRGQHGELQAREDQGRALGGDAARRRLGRPLRVDGEVKRDSLRCNARHHPVRERMDAARGHGAGGSALFGLCLRASPRRCRAVLLAADGCHPAGVHVSGALRHVLQGRLPPDAPRVVASVGADVQSAPGGHGHGHAAADAAVGGGEDSARGAAHVRHRPLRHRRRRGDAEAGRQPGADHHLHLPVELPHGAPGARVLPHDREGQRRVVLGRLLQDSLSGDGAAGAAHAAGIYREAPPAPPAPAHHQRARPVVLSVGLLADDCHGHHAEEHRSRPSLAAAALGHRPAGAAALRGSVCRGPLHRPLLPPHAGGRTGAGAEEHRLRHLDGLHLSEPLGQRRPRLLYTVAEHREFGGDLAPRQAPRAVVVASIFSQLFRVFGL